jgi:hypothetical protein
MPHPTIVQPVGALLTATVPILPLPCHIFSCLGTLHDEDIPLKPQGPAHILASLLLHSAPIKYFQKKGKKKEKGKDEEKECHIPA